MTSKYTTTTNVNAQDINTDTITASGSSILNNLNIIDDLQRNSISGDIGNTIVRTGASSSVWGTVPFKSLSIGSANQTFTTDNLGTVTQWTNGTVSDLFATFILGAQNWNASTAGIQLTFTGTSSSSNFGTDPILDFTFGTNEFTVTVSGTYTLDLCAVLTRVTGGTVQVYFTLRINGVAVSRRIYSSIKSITAGLATVVGTFTVGLAAGSVITFWAHRVTTNGNFSCDPNYSYCYMYLEDTTVAT